MAQDVEGAATLDLAGQALEEAVVDLDAVVLLEPGPLLGLGGEDEVEDVAGDQAQGAVVVVRSAAVVAAGAADGAGGGEAVGRTCLAHLVACAGHVVRTAGQQRLLDGFLEGALGDLGHQLSSVSRIWQRSPRSLFSLMDKTYMTCEEVPTLLSTSVGAGSFGRGAVRSIPGFLAASRQSRCGAS